MPPPRGFAKRGSLIGASRLDCNQSRLRADRGGKRFRRAGEGGRIQRQGRDIINLGIGQPDFKTPPHIVEAAVKALRDGEHGYTDATGIQPLREAVAEDLDRRLRVEVSPDDVLIVPGGKVTMFMAIMMFGERAPTSSIPIPAFRSTAR